MRKKQGVVVSNKMQKTVTVEVTGYKVHPLYKKRYPFSTKFYAHTEDEVAEGTLVTIEEIAPMSKTKRWKVVTVHND